MAFTLTMHGDQRFVYVLKNRDSEPQFYIGGAAMRAAGGALATLRGPYVAPLDVAMFYAEAGEKDLTLEWLEKTFDAGDPNANVIVLNPQFENLHPEPRFQALVARLKLPR